MRILLALLCIWLMVAVVFPVGEILLRSLLDRDGRFIGLGNFKRYFSSTALSSSLYNSLLVSCLTTLLSVPLGFVYAYALTRTRVRWKPFFRAVAMTPLYLSLIHI